MEKITISDPDGIMDVEGMDINAEEGYKVTVTEQTINWGWDYDKENANKYLKVGNVYTIEKTNIGEWHTDVYLKEIPNISFNSVHFVPIKNPLK